MACGSLGVLWALASRFLRLALPERRRGGLFVSRGVEARCPAARYGVLALGAAAEHAAQRESMEHSLSAGLKVWSVNGPKTSKGRLERAGYPLHLNAKPGGHRLSSLEPRAAKRVNARAPS